jgi:inner membrane protein
MEYASGSQIAVRLWFHTWLILSIGFLAYSLSLDTEFFSLLIFIASAACAAVGSVPALLILFMLLPVINNCVREKDRLLVLFLLQLAICGIYGFFTYLALHSEYSNSDDYSGAIATGVLFLCSAIATAINHPGITAYFRNYTEEAFTIEEEFSINHDAADINTYNLATQNNTHMEQNTPELATTETKSNKTLIKGIITGVLILVMLIPTLFITNLVREREARQGEVVKEINDKWAAPQTITGPYISVPYVETFRTNDNKDQTVRKLVTLIPEELKVNGSIDPELRKRSIYTVLLYRSNLSSTGRFKIQAPADIDVNKLVLNEARLCIGINDFKGIEEKVTINFNGNPYDLTPGLPGGEKENRGLSASIPLTLQQLSIDLPFNFNLKLKGSQQLSFVPLSGDSKFTLKSKWANPSFDGVTVPTERVVNADGFTATWNFNKANLPFSSFMKDFDVTAKDYNFGVSMLQPADQYAKTMRSVKYAILFIGLTFSLFFIIEIMQNKPVHPVQYVLVGLALVIFYTLLLSISEFVNFDNAYAIAAAATVSLITLYAKGHFGTWKIASVFALVLGMLYSFIFVLIRLEDTALLVGSIGLFIVLALVMYASRKINWYNPSFNKSSIETA